MRSAADKSKKENPSRSVGSQPLEKNWSGKATLSFVDNRPEAVQLGKLQEMADESPQARKTAQLQVMMDNSPQVVAPRQQLNRMSGETMQRQDALEGEQPRQGNRTGLPDDLETGIENLSGMPLDNVTVHYNSSKPAQLQALAYTQGTNIHVAPGQEQHLAHEAWHVVQQSQRRVKPTMALKGASVNDDPGLEKEADVMGQRAAQQNVRSSEERNTWSERSGVAETASIQRLAAVNLELEQTSSNCGVFALYNALSSMGDAGVGMSTLKTMLETAYGVSAVGEIFKYEDMNAMAVKAGYSTKRIEFGGIEDFVKKAQGTGSNPVLIAYPFNTETPTPQEPHWGVLESVDKTNVTMWEPNGKRFTIDTATFYRAHIKLKGGTFDWDAFNEEPDWSSEDEERSEEEVEVEESSEPDRDELLTAILTSRMSGAVAYDLGGYMVEVTKGERVKIPGRGRSYSI